jgi:hypothetical protein
MPWQGYFELISKADVFIFLDNYQFSRQSWQQRNRLFIDKDRVGWYTVPMINTVSFKSPCNETRIHEGNQWRKKMWMRIKTNYGKCEHFDSIGNEIESWLLQSPSSSLSAFNIYFIEMICAKLGIRPEFRTSSHLLHKPGKRSQGVLDLLHVTGATRYYCAHGSFGYMAQDGIFPVSDIETVFQNFQCKPYYQRGSPQQFIPYLSVIDAIMNVGLEKTGEMIQNGTEKWMTWEEMHDREHKHIT